MFLSGFWPPARRMGNYIQKLIHCMKQLLHSLNFTWHRETLLTKIKSSALLTPFRVNQALTSLLPSLPNASLGLDAQRPSKVLELPYSHPLPNVHLGWTFVFFWDPVTWIALYLTLYQIFLCHFNTDNISPSDVSTQCNLKTRSCWIILRRLSKEARPVVWLRQVTHLSSNNCIGWFLCSQQLQWLIEPVCWCLLDILASLSSLEPKYGKLKDIQKLWKGDSWKLETSKWYKISFEKKSVFSYWISPKTYWD